MKKYTQAPLPFQGQKRRFIKQFKEALKEFPEDAVYVDLFGGSGLLAHTVKHLYPQATVIWNDYDNFKKRLESIANTNALLAKLRVILKGLPRKQRITCELREVLLNVIKKHEIEYSYVDYITLSGSLLFSAKYVRNFNELIKETFYNRIKIKDYHDEGYLDGVERLQDDYKVIYNTYKGNRTIFLVDPPYLSTDTSTYSSGNYWKLKDYLDVLNVLDSSRYFYFTSNKSQIVELCDWIETRTHTGNPFQGAVTATSDTRLNYNSSYTDIMLYR